MKNVKKCFGLLLVFCMVIGMLSGCGEQKNSTTESTTKSTTASSQSTTQATTVAPTPTPDPQPWKGREITVWGYGLDYITNEDNEILYPFDSNSVAYAAIEEWCEKNGVTWKNVSGNGNGTTEALLAAIASGNTPDIYYGYAAQPIFANMGLAQSIDGDKLDEMKDKYGAMYFDTMTFKGQTYGAVMPWASVVSLQYNLTWLEANGVKTPREYWEEGTWNYENFFKYLQECNTDVEGDGTWESRGMAKNAGFGRYLVSNVSVGEDGRISSNFSTDRMRDLLQYLYEGYSVNKSLTGLPGNIINRFWLIEPYFLNTMYYYDADGNVWECVPTPYYKEEGDSSTFINYMQILVPNGCPDLEMSLDLFDWFMECGMAAMDDSSDGKYDFDFEGLQGTTAFSKKFLEVRAAKNKNANSIIYDMPEYNEDHAEALIEFYQNCEYFMQPVMTGVTWDITTSNTYKDIWTVPAATSIAQYLEVSQAECDKYNKTYIWE